MKTRNSRRGNTQEGRVAKNKVILNVIQDLQRLPLSLLLINNLRGRSHIKYGMTPLFDNNGCVEDAQQQPLSIRSFNKDKKPGMTTYVMSGSHPTYKGDSAPSVCKDEALNKNPFRAPLRSGFTARTVTPQGRYAGDSGRIGFTLIELLVVVLIIGILAAVAVPQYQKAVEKSRWTEWISVMNALEKDAKMAYLENAFPSDGRDDYDICRNFSVGHLLETSTKDFSYNLNDCYSDHIYVDTYRRGSHGINVEAYFYSNGTKEFIVYINEDNPMTEMVYQMLASYYGTSVVKRN